MLFCTLIIVFCTIVEYQNNHPSSKNASASTNENNLVDESLRANIRLLGDSLGRTITHDLGKDFLDKIETIREYAKRRDDGTQLHDYLRNLPEKYLLPVARAFNQFLQLANIAEQHHRAHSGGGVDDYNRNGAGGVSLRQVFKRVEAEKNNAKDLLLETLSKMRIELVLTAHPTETIRRTLIKKYDLIEECLGSLEMLNTESDEKSISRRVQRTKERLEELICQSWHTNEFRTEKPSPVDGKSLIFLLGTNDNLVLLSTHRSKMGFCCCRNFPLGSFGNILTRSRSTTS